MSLAFVTDNTGKFTEVAAIIPGISQIKMELDELQSLDIRVIIEHKLAQASSQYSGPLFVEDTTLIFHCLGKLPGPFIKYFEQSLNNQRLADLVSRYDDHTATASSVLGYRDQKGVVHFFEGHITGTIVAPRGTKNPFGWNNIFQPHGHDETFAEMSIDVKNQMSMRGIAARKLSDFVFARR